MCQATFCALARRSVRAPPRTRCRGRTPFRTRSSRRAPRPRPEGPRGCRHAFQKRRSTGATSRLEGALPRPWCAVHPVYTFSEILGHPQVVESDLIQTVDHPPLGPIPQVGPVVGMHDTPGAIATPPPLLGEHSLSVLRDAAKRAPRRRLRRGRDRCLARRRGGGGPGARPRRVVTEPWTPGYELVIVSRLYARPGADAEVIAASPIPSGVPNGKGGLS
jgi:hypothetical protein